MLKHFRTALFYPLLFLATTSCQSNPAYAQAGPSYTCAIPFSLSAVGTTAVFDNRTRGCINWNFNYGNSGFATLSVQIEGANDASGSPGSWTAFASPTAGGPNPNTNTTGGFASFNVYYPWVRINLTATTGAGAVYGDAFGGSGASAFKSSGGAATGPAGTVQASNGSGSLTQAYLGPSIKPVSPRLDANVLGSGACGSVATGISIVCIGDHVFNAATNLSEAIGIGGSSGLKVTTGNDLIAIGDCAMCMQPPGTSPSSDIAIGNGALGSGTGGAGAMSSIVAIGNGAVSVAGGGSTDIIGIGDGVLGHMTSGADNVAIGDGVFTNLVSGHDNIAIGDGAGVGLTSGNYNISIGQPSNAAGDSYKLKIENNPADAATPLITADFSARTIQLNGAVTCTSGCGGGGVSSVTATAPLTSSGGATPNISATYQGNGAKIQASTGTTTTNDCVKYDANGNTVDAGAPCGSGGSGPTTQTNVTGSRSIGTVFQNTTGKMMWVSAVFNNPSGVTGNYNGYSDSAASPTYVPYQRSVVGVGFGLAETVIFMVPNNYYYKITVPATATLSLWTEWN